MSIPILTGVLTLADFVLPYQNIRTKVVSKDTSYRAKYDRTTYNIVFEKFNEQFTSEIYNSFFEGDEVVLKAMFFTKEVIRLKHIQDVKFIENLTYEKDILLLFGFLYLVPLIWIFKKKSLSNKQCYFALGFVFMGTASLIRIIVIY